MNISADVFTGLHSVESAGAWGASNWEPKPIAKAELARIVENEALFAKALKADRKARKEAAKGRAPGFVNADYMGVEALASLIPASAALAKEDRELWNRVCDWLDSGTAPAVLIRKAGTFETKADANYARIVTLAASLKGIPAVSVRILDSEEECEGAACAELALDRDSYVAD
jgi:hypothetical protein